MPSSPSKQHPGPEVELNLRPGVHLSPPRPPGLGLAQPQARPQEQLDDLADAFGGAFNVTNAPNDTNRPHPRFSQYKVKGQSTADQEVRRARLLSHQRNRRDDLINHARCLATGDFTEEKDDEDEEVEPGEDMDTGSEVRVRKLRKTYKNQLMLSEWLVEVPQDLSTNWLMILVPEGRRNFVVASNGQTKVYSKSGKQVKSFPSNLPGGNRSQGGRKGPSYTILDCVYSSDGTFYILDMMCWDGYQYYDCDTEFRLSWVQQKFIEHQELTVKSRINPYSFMPLPVYQCTRDSISQALNSALPFNDNLDGILIYHRHLHYMPGKTPLVGWLKGYMVPELLGIEVCEELMAQRPHDYGGMKTYLKKTFDRVERQKKEDEDKVRRENDTMHVENGDHH